MVGSSFERACGGSGSAMADIIPFLKFLKDHDRAFDAETTRLMGEAFDRATAMLRDKGQPHIVMEVIAKRIIKVATSGERDPDELARRGLLALGIETDEPPRAA